MELRRKRAYDNAERSDGFRVLVDRLWPRGASKEREHDTGTLIYAAHDEEHNHAVALEAALRELL